VFWRIRTMPQPRSNKDPIRKSETYSLGWSKKSSGPKLVPNRSGALRRKLIPGHETLFEDKGKAE
jgi:hypothetical protein